MEHPLSQEGRSIFELMSAQTWEYCLVKFPCSPVLSVNILHPRNSPQCLSLSSSYKCQTLFAYICIEPLCLSLWLKNWYHSCTAQPEGEEWRVNLLLSGRKFCGIVGMLGRCTCSGERRENVFIRISNRNKASEMINYLFPKGRNLHILFLSLPLTDFVIKH